MYVHSHMHPCNMLQLEAACPLLPPCILGGISLSDLPLVLYQLSHLASPYVLLKTFTWAHVVVVAEVSSSVLLRENRNSI